MKKCSNSRTYSVLVAKYVPDTAGCAILVLENVCANHIASLPHMILQILPLSLKR